MGYGARTGWNNVRGICDERAARVGNMTRRHSASRWNMRGIRFEAAVGRWGDGMNGMRSH
jgi:hypothetical protein